MTQDLKKIGWAPADKLHYNRYAAEYKHSKFEDDDEEPPRPDEEPERTHLNDQIIFLIEQIK